FDLASPAPTLRGQFGRAGYVSPMGDRYPIAHRPRQRQCCTRRGGRTRSDGGLACAFPVVRKRSDTHSRGGVSSRGRSRPPSPSQRLRRTWPAQRPRAASPPLSISPIPCPPTFRPSSVYRASRWRRNSTSRRMASIFIGGG